MLECVQFFNVYWHLIFYFPEKFFGKSWCDGVLRLHEDSTISWWARHTQYIVLMGYNEILISKSD